MKKQYLFLLIAIGFFASAEAQFGNRSGMRGGMRGRNQSQIPQAQQKPEDIKPPTAQEILDARMPEITLAIGLNPFEEAVVSTTLVKFCARARLRLLFVLPLPICFGLYEKS